MRIEMVLPALVRAGMETVTANLARVLIDRGHEVGFTCIEWPGELGLDLREQGLRVSVVSAPGILPNLLPRELGSWFRQLAPDVVHAHSGVWLKAVQGAHAAAVPMAVYTAHGMAGLRSWAERMYGRVAARRTDRIVAVSEALKSHMVTALAVSDGRVDVIPNGVPTSRFAPGPAPPTVRGSLGIPADATVIGNVARLHPVKNHALLIDAFARLRQSRPEVFLLLVGDGPLRAQIEERVAALGLTPYVRITGLVRDTVTLLRAMDLFVLSSNTEGTSISILEALATGIPVVATAVGGNPALLDHGRCGLLTPPGDVGALSGTLERLLGDPGHRDQLVSAALQRVATRYSVDAMADAYERVYRDEPLCT